MLRGLTMALKETVFPGGKRFLTGTVELRSNLILEVVGTIQGSAGHIAIPPKNPFYGSQHVFEVCDGGA